MERTDLLKAGSSNPNSVGPNLSLASSKALSAHNFTFSPGLGYSTDTNRYYDSQTTSEIYQHLHTKRLVAIDTYII